MAFGRALEQFKSRINQEDAYQLWHLLLQAYKCSLGEEHEHKSFYLVTNQYINILIDKGNYIEKIPNFFSEIQDAANKANIALTSTYYEMVAKIHYRLEDYEKSLDNFKIAYGNTQSCDTFNRLEILHQYKILFEHYLTRLNFFIGQNETQTINEWLGRCELLADKMISLNLYKNALEIYDDLIALSMIDTSTKLRMIEKRLNIHDYETGNKLLVPANFETQQWHQWHERIQLYKNKMIAGLEKHLCFELTNQYSNNSVGEFRQSKEVYNKSMISLLSEIINYCTKLIGSEPPTNFVILGLGSISRKGLLPKSDLEFAILLDNGNHKGHPYFQFLIKLINFYLKLANDDFIIDSFAQSNLLPHSSRHAVECCFINDIAGYKKFLSDTNILTRKEIEQFILLRTSSLYLSSQTSGNLFNAYQQQVNEIRNENAAQYAIHELSWQMTQSLKYNESGKDNLSNLRVWCSQVALYHGFWDEDYGLAVNLEKHLEYLVRANRIEKKVSDCLLSININLEVIYAIKCKDPRVSEYLADVKKYIIDPLYRSFSLALTFPKDEIPAFDEAFYDPYSFLISSGVREMVSKYGSISEGYKALSSPNSKRNSALTEAKNYTNVNIQDISPRTQTRNSNDLRLYMMNDAIEIFAFHQVCRNATSRDHQNICHQLSAEQYILYYKTLERFLLNEQIESILPNLYHRSGERLYYSKKFMEWKDSLPSLLTTNPKDNEANKELSHQLLSYDIYFSQDPSKASKSTLKDYLVETEQKSFSKLDYAGQRIIVLNSFNKVIIMPGIEVAMRLLSTRLKAPIYNSELAKISNGKNKYPVFIADTIKGKSLQETYLSDPSLLDNNSSLSRLLLLSILLNVQGSLDNYIFCQSENNSEQNTIYALNNSGAFDDAIYKEQAAIGNDQKYKINSKNILFCLDQMNKPLNNDVVDEFCQLDIYSTLQQWLKALDEANGHYMALLGEPLIKEFYQHKIKILAMFSSEQVKKIYHKFTVMQRVLRVNAGIHVIDLLETVESMLAIPYRKILLSGQNLTEREKLLKSNDYLYDLEAHKSSLKMVALAEEHKSWESISSYPYEAHNALSDKYNRQRIIVETKNRLLKDEAGLTQEQKLNHMQEIQLTLQSLSFEEIEELLKELDFSNLSNREKIEAVMINNLKDRPIEQKAYEKLYFTGLQSLSYKALIAIMGANTLKILSLVNLPNLSFNTYQKINDSEKYIKELTLSKLPKLNSFELKNNFSILNLLWLSIDDCSRLRNISFHAPKLHHLQLKNCSTLDTVTIEASELSEMSVSNCNSLFKLETQSSNLKKISLEHCEKITTKSLQSIGNDYTQTLLVLKDCESVSRHKDFWQDFPWLMQWAELLTDPFITLFHEKFKNQLIELEIKSNGIDTATKKELVALFGRWIQRKNDLIQSLKPKLKNKNLDKLNGAILALSHFNQIEEVPLLDILAMLKNNDESVRLSTIAALHRWVSISSEMILNTLLMRFKIESDRVRSAILHLLEDFIASHSTHIFDTMQKWLTSNVIDLQEAATLLISKLNINESVDLLKAQLKSKKIDLRKVIVHSLGKIGASTLSANDRSNIAEILWLQLDEKNWPYRQAVIEALHYFNNDVCEYTVLNYLENNLFEKNNLIEQLHFYQAIFDGIPALNYTNLNSLVEKSRLWLRRFDLNVSKNYDDNINQSLVSLRKSIIHAIGYLGNQVTNDIFYKIIFDLLSEMKRTDSKTRIAALEMISELILGNSNKQLIFKSLAILLHNDDITKIITDISLNKKNRPDPNATITALLQYINQNSLTNDNESKESHCSNKYMIRALLELLKDDQLSLDNLLVLANIAEVNHIVLEKLSNTTNKIYLEKIINQLCKHARDLNYNDKEAIVEVIVQLAHHHANPPYLITELIALTNNSDTATTFTLIKSLAQLAEKHEHELILENLLLYLTHKDKRLQNESANSLVNLGKFHFDLVIDKLVKKFESSDWKLNNIIIEIFSRLGKDNLQNVISKLDSIKNNSNGKIKFKIACIFSALHEDMLFYSTNKILSSLIQRSGSSLSIPRERKNDEGFVGNINNIERKMEISVNYQFIGSTNNNTAPSIEERDNSLNMEHKFNLSEERNANLNINSPSHNF